MSIVDESNTTYITSDVPPRNRQLTLLDLPQFLLEEVIIWIRRMIMGDGYLRDLRRMVRWDGYFSDLRLISRRFNEAVIHCLLLRDNRSPFNDGHFISRYHGVLSGRFKDVRCNPTYARFYLQSYILSSREPDKELARFHRRLNECLCIFQHILGQNPNLFKITQARLGDSLYLRTASSNPVLTDKHCQALCEAVMIYLDVCHCKKFDCNLDSFALWVKQELSQYNTVFWLQCLACYFSDSELLEWAIEEARHDNEITNGVATEHAQLLGILASCGHTALFEQYLSSVPKGVDLSFALRGACLSGSMPLASLIFHAVSGDQLAALCSKTLTRIELGRYLPCGYADVAEELLKRRGEILGYDELALILYVQADLGASNVVRLLLTKHRGRNLYPIRGCMTQTPIFACCVNRDLQLLRDVVSMGYFDRTRNKKDIDELYLHCEHAAAQANSLEILKQLCDYQNKQLHDVKLNVLAAINGSIPAMTKRLEVNCSSSQNKNSQDETYLALKSAIERLRVNNAKFLLDRGVPLEERHFKLRLEWRYRYAHEQDFQEMRALLRKYNSVKVLEVGLI